MRTFANVLWAGIAIIVTVLLADSPWLSNDNFLRMMEIKGIMLCVGAFIYGLFFGRSLD